MFSDYPKNMTKEEWDLSRYTLNNSDPVKIEQVKNLRKMKNEYAIMKNEFIRLANFYDKKEKISQSELEKLCNHIVTTHYEYHNDRYYDCVLCGKSDLSLSGQDHEPCHKKRKVNTYDKDVVN